MVPHEAFACSFAEGDPPKHFGCGFFMERDRLRQLMSSPGAQSAGPSTPPSYSSGPSKPPSCSSGPSTPPNYSSGSSRNAECSNCKHLRRKISVLKATMKCICIRNNTQLIRLHYFTKFLMKWKNLIWSSLSFAMCNVIRMIWISLSFAM
nr:hypothetical protein [Tanacetum cinerariifolium]